VPGAFALEPPAERPRTPDTSYGVPAEGGRFIGWATCIGRLRAAEAYWLATTGVDGSPHVVPVWGVIVDDDLYLETGAANTVKARDLARSSLVAIHLDGVNDALIVHGRAEACRPDATLAAALAAAFTSKYKGYAPAPTDWDEGGLHRIHPRVMLAWRDMPTATRWKFAAG
jgi:nitroimidazol reductase NimA-like FMN-containing flavoprotein (pyridoxamine 5'-phosphate oxidase superfamily)